MLLNLNRVEKVRKLAPVMTGPPSSTVTIYFLNLGISLEALDIERSHRGEGVEDKCRNDKGHDLRYRPDGLKYTCFFFNFISKALIIFTIYISDI